MLLYIIVLVQRVIMRQITGVYLNFLNERISLNMLRDTNEIGLNIE